MRSLWIGLFALIASGCASQDANRDAYAADYLYRCEMRGGVQRLACLDIYRSRFPEHAARRGS